MARAARQSGAARRGDQAVGGDARAAAAHRPGRRLRLGRGPGGADRRPDLDVTRRRRARAAQRRPERRARDARSRLPADPEEARAAQGVKDMVRISDARMSGTAFGTIVLHIAPGSRRSAGRWRWCGRRSDRARRGRAPARAAGRRGRARSARRAAGSRPRTRRPSPRLRALYLRSVLQADEGCDFDFC